MPDMTEHNDGTAPGEGEAPATGEAPAAAAAPANDELTTLKSRNSGLNAKVTELQKQLADERNARTAAEQAVASKAGTDDVLNQRIATLQAEIETSKREVAVANIKAKYPEAAELLGDAVANLSPEVLAATEARLVGQKDDGVETPKPVGNNQQRQSATKNIEDMTSKELQAHMRQLDPSILGLPSA
jgi:chromosome segregation ATPase